ncbi:MAG: hypothetical protein GY778_24515 [bacterium]|nr:hypothetical protein [bacterium]
MGHTALSTSRRRLAQSAGILVLAGVALRVAYAVRCGVGYDEVFVMGIGLDELLDSWRALLIDVPVRRSDGITPLWWWVQAVACFFGGHPSLIGLRVGPVVLGTGALLLTWRVAAARLGRGPAVVLVGLVAVSDALAFTNARGEFAESLLVLLVLPAALLAGQPRRGGLKGSLWLLLLMTHLGKGAFLVAGLALAEGISVLLQRHHRDARSAVRELTKPILIAGLPTVAWLVLLNTTTFASGPVATDAGLRDSVWHALSAITFGYTQVKAHIVAGPFDAMQVYLDGAIWPTTTILAVPLIVGLIAALGAGRRRHMLSLSLLPWIAIGLVAVIGRGVLGARFHLLYLPAVWIVAAMGLWRLRQARARTILMCGLVWIIHLAVAFSWTSWTERAVGLSQPVSLSIALAIAVVTVVILGWGRPGHRLPAVAVVGFLSVAAVGTGGPWRWGPAARFEPMAGSTADQERNLLVAIDRWRDGDAVYPQPHGRTLYIDLANAFLRKPNASLKKLDLALRYALLEADRVPNDARAWFYVGLAHQQSGHPVEQVRQAWRRSLELRPNPKLAERLNALE